MIQPRDEQQVKYVHNLAAFLIRAQAQVDAGDKPGSVQFTDGFRSLKQWGETRYPQENGGLVEWAEMLSREEPRNDRLVAFLAEQDARLAKSAPVSGEARAGPYSVKAAEPPREPPLPPTTLANVVQRPSDKKSDTPALTEPRPAPVAPKPPHIPSPVLEGNDQKRAAQATRRKSRAKKGAE